MYYIEKTANLVVDINNYQQGFITDGIILAKVCEYFDFIRTKELNTHDLEFLKFISNLVGAPHYFDLLGDKFNHKIDLDKISLQTMSACMYESTLHTSEDKKLHKFQKYVLDQFKKESLNRYFLSASTSFGKTHLVYEIIKKMEYKNIVLIFPTIALLSENLERLMLNHNGYFDNYELHTLSDVRKLSQKNIFIYTPERYLSFIENKDNLTLAQNIDFVFIDEFYKIDNDYVIDDEVKENERDVAYRLASHHALEGRVDAMLAGPYITYSKDQKGSFNLFLTKNNFEMLDYNHIELVQKTFDKIKGKVEHTIDKSIQVDLRGISSKYSRLNEILQSLNLPDENSIVYFNMPHRAEQYAMELIDDYALNSDHDLSQYTEFLNHLKSSFPRDWIVTRGLENGIGIHHGQVPKYIQKEIIKLFNSNKLKFLFSTTTITEGVNTSAKNLIVVDDKKGNKPLKKFDAQNIAGRAGRFLQHYQGRVIIFENSFDNVLKNDGVDLRHKNYDEDSIKDEIDLFYTDDFYLTPEDIAHRESIETEQIDKNLPDSLFTSYKAISRKDKMKLFDTISALSNADMDLIKECIKRINSGKCGIDWYGFDIILSCISPIISNSRFQTLVAVQCKTGGYKLLTTQVSNYLEGGLKQLIDRKRDSGVKTNPAILQSNKFIYTTLKYQLVKYLGVFNIFYKYIESEKSGVDSEGITGLDRLLIKLEHNAFTENGRKASDYGVPQKVLEYFENDNSLKMKSMMDSYELEVLQKVKKII